MNTATIRAPRRCSGVALTTALLAGMIAAMPGVVGTAHAQGTGMMTKTLAAPLPSSVVLFPAVFGSDAAPAAGTTKVVVPMNQQNAQRIVTESLRSLMDRAKIGVVVYNRRLPSIQRAVQEGTKPEDAAAGPGDDPRKAQKFAGILGANEYVTTTIDDYKFDPATRMVTFNLSVTRYASDGTGLGATAVKAVGSAPADVAGAHQESYADQAASQVVAEQAIEGLYPQTAAILNPPKTAPKKNRRSHKIGGTFLVPAIAIGAAIIGPRT